MTVMIVGEAFGAEEERENRPFVGKSGQLLTKTLQKLGFERDNFYITNVFMTRPPDNDINYFFGGFKKDICEGMQAYNGKFLLAEFSTHLYRLQNEIIREKPDLIIGLGNVPYWCFTGNSGGITKARGKILTETYGPIKLKTNYMPTYHPSFMLRNQTNNQLNNDWFSDILEAKKYI